MYNEFCAICPRASQFESNLCNSCKRSLKASYNDWPISKINLKEINLISFKIFRAEPFIVDLCSKAKKEKKAANFLKTTINRNCFYKLAVCGASDILFINQKRFSKFQLEIDLNHFLSSQALQYTDSKNLKAIRRSSFREKIKISSYEQDTNASIYTNPYGLVISESISDVSLKSLEKISKKQSISDIIAISIY